VRCASPDPSSEAAAGRGALAPALLAERGLNAGGKLIRLTRSYLLGMLRKRRALEVSAAPSFEAGDWVLMHSLDNTRVWRGTVLEYDAPGDLYRVEWDGNFVSSVRSFHLEADEQ
jgi:hypothetical protein